MGEFHDDGGTYQIDVGHGFAELGAQRHQQRAKTFAPSGDDVVGGLGDERGVSACLPRQLLLDQCELRGDVVGELVTHVLRHGTPRRRKTQRV